VVGSKSVTCDEAPRMPAEGEPPAGWIGRSKKCLKKGRRDSYGRGGTFSLHRQRCPAAGFLSLQMAPLSRSGGRKREDSPSGEGGKKAGIGGKEEAFLRQI